MRSSITAPFVLLSGATIAGVGRQAPSSSLTPAGAKAHVGEAATVCGQIDEYSCGPVFSTLFFAPSDPEPFTLRPRRSLPSSS